LLRRLRPSDEGGFTLVELMASLTVLTVGLFSLAAALGIGFRQVALGRQRQTAADIANARVEHLRSVPFEAVALCTSTCESAAPEYDDDEEKPNHFLSTDSPPSQYDYSGTETFEDLIVDDGGGQVRHVEDPVQVGQTTMEVWQYVTWLDQANNVKRLTVIVVYKPAAVSGVSRMVRVSSFFTPGTVTVAGSQPDPTQGSGTPTPNPSPTPTGSCSGDTTAPTGSFTLLSTSGETGYTATTSIVLTMSFSDACTPIQARFTNDQGATWSDWVTYDATNPGVTWTLTSGEGSKDVDAEVRDAPGNVRSLFTPDIILDTIPPTPPGQLSRSVSCSGTSRTVTLTWGSSTDAHFSGYRVYESDNNGAWALLTSTSQLTATTMHAKGLDSVRFKVVAYDKAGNESDETNTISLAKNQCS
jgi:Tfp pilus assembly protein FimT